MEINVSAVADAVLKALQAGGTADNGDDSIPVGISNRHIHLSREHIDILFGAIPYRGRQVMLMSGKVDKFEKAFGIFPNTDFDQALLSEIESMR